LGFVHSLPEIRPLTFSDAPVLRHKEFVLGEPGFIFPAVGDPALRKNVHDEYRSLGWAVPSVFHPSCVIAPDATVGDGVYVGAHSVIETMAHIGTGAIIDIGSIIDHEVEVAEYSHITPGTVLMVSRGAML
jgi:acetyltransferase-like isoleucine patch superfamily enzyme